jgi:hypothetical protein
MSACSWFAISPVSFEALKRLIFHARHHFMGFIIFKSIFYKLILIKLCLYIRYRYLIWALSYYKIWSVDASAVIGVSILCKKCLMMHVGDSHYIPGAPMCSGLPQIPHLADLTPTYKWRMCLCIAWALDFPLIYNAKIFDELASNAPRLAHSPNSSAPHLKKQNT